MLFIFDHCYDPGPFVRIRIVLFTLSPDSDREKIRIPINEKTLEKSKYEKKIPQNDAEHFQL